ncbi:MAG: prepilin peptidase [Planctomycetaceae bacterium]|nr:prepilin peptidase [Planctomycetaceae bacterium]
MTPFDLPLWIVLTFLFLFGCCIGSFLNVCVYRFPQHDRLWDQLKGIHTPPSFCPRCKQKISPRDNVPILGWLMLGGKCRNCGLSISPRYPLVELLNGLLFVGLYVMEVPADYLATIEESHLYTPLGPQIVEDWSSELHMNLRYLYHLVLVEALLVASLIDWDLKIIPDGSTVPAMVVGVLGGAAIGHVHLVPVWFQDPSLARAFMSLFPESWQWMAADVTVPEWTIVFPHLHGLAVSVAGFLVGGGIDLGSTAHRALGAEAGSDGVR